MTPANLPSEAPVHRDPTADTDPLLHLHKMSTTAGLGTQEYVAINVTAVVAALFGVASLLAMLNNILMVIPFVGAVLSCIALAQIRNSNGTQTGRGLALLGILLCGGISIGLICTRVIEGIHRGQDQRAIANLCQQFGSLIAQKKYDDAFNLFDSDFQDHVKLDPFKIHLASIQESKVSPPIDQAAWNGLIQFQTDDQGTETADTVMKIHYKDMAGDERADARFRRSAGGPWRIDNLPGLFPAPAQPGASPRR
jgi:hypothetical protein